MNSRLYKYLFPAVVIVIAFTSSKAQNFCGTPSPNSTLLKQTFSRYENNINTRNDIKYLPLSIHVIRNNDGTGGIRLWNVYSDACILNDNYRNTGIQFYIDSVYFKNNTAYYDHDFSGGYTMIVTENIPNTINCYYVGNPAGNCGYFFPGADGIVNNYSCMGAGSRTWAHEMGHFLSLPHTFYGWEGGGVPTEKENVSGSNCTTTGDFICDTKPDYIASRWTCNANGVSATVFTDMEGAQFQVDGSNYMSYSNDGCMSLFTPGQMDNMNANIDMDRVNLPITPSSLPSISDTAILIQPAPNGVINSAQTSGTYFEWSAVPGATHYLLQVSRWSAYSEYFWDTVVTSTSVHWNRILTTNRKYYWKVKAVNYNDFCGNEAKSYYNHSSITNVEDISSNDAQINIIPNPTSQSFRIWSSEIVNHIEIKNSEGKSVALIKTPELQNSLEVDTRQYAKGFYTVIIFIKGKNYTRKLIVQ